MVSLSLAAPARCLHHLFEEQARRAPERAALVFEEQRLSYAELDLRAGRLASWLQGQGAGPEVLVGLIMERSLEMMVGMLAILKAGAAYLPIDADFPEARVKFILEDSGAKLLLTQASVLPRLPQGAAQALCVDSFDWTG